MGRYSMGVLNIQTGEGAWNQTVSVHGGLFRTYHDHRMAHAAVIIGLAVDDLLVEDVATTSKTFPGFVDAWTRLA